MRPLLEYGSAVWDPYLQKDIQSIEMVQRCAVCWVKSYYRYNSSVTSMLEELQCMAITSTPTICGYRLKLFYNIANSSSVLSIPNYFMHTTYPTHHHHSFHFEIPFARTDHHLLPQIYLWLEQCSYLLTLLNPNLYNCF